MLVLSKEEIYQTIDWVEVVDVVGGAFAAISEKRALVPLRTAVPLPEQEALLLLMPGYLSGDPAVNGLAVKTVGLFYHNPPKNLPLIYGLVTLFDQETGQPLAIFDGATITAIRTGGASGSATRLLAKEGAKRLALFGAGAQAETQLKAICAVRPIEEVLICSRDQQKAKDFAERFSTETERNLRVVTDSAEALQGAEVVVTATTSRQPVFHDTNLEAGAHINGVGSYTHEMREVPGETVARARLIVDSRESCLSEAGDVLIPINEGLIDESHIYAELGEIVAGHKPGRAGMSADDITFFKSVGNAAQDVALAVYLYRRAKAQGIGTEVRL
jgi:ornithine cyclodeaminase/alanine dehydrogenase-like protein (mu-crystallin family)